MKMGVPHITTFCWCMGLESGTKVIAYLHLLTSVVNVSVCSVAAANAKDLAGTDIDPDKVYGRLAAVALTVAVISSVHVLLATLLMIAVHKWIVKLDNRRKKPKDAAEARIKEFRKYRENYYGKRFAPGLRVWVCVMCALWLAALAYVVVSSVASKPRASGSDMFLSFLEGVVFFGIVAYCILCVNSYYMVLRSVRDIDINDLEKLPY
ncbi:uncharacterized protein [Battus philenor]|uniref:uncharacterized protein isoform X1 n=1 Tax=Battus philenor TaxID=42288 RepID=UPI0035CF55B9